MRKVFENRLEAIEWIAEHAEDEGQFEVMREQLIFNFIYTGKYFVDKDGPIMEVVMLSNDEEE